MSSREEAVSVPIDLDLSLSPPVQAAIVAAVVALVTSLLTAWLSHRRLKREYALEFAAERLVMRLLTVQDWEWRSFAAIKQVIGGFEDDELRRLLVRSGAFRGYTKTGRVEMWSHISTNPNAWPPKGEPAGDTLSWRPDRAG
jgi:hypothetical protein